MARSYHPAPGAQGRAGGVSWLALLASTGTLICCALPVALVALGMGSAVAALIGHLPFLVPLTAHKEWIFAGSALLMLLAAWRVRAAGRACPADPQLAAQCRRIQTWNRMVLGVAATTWAVGFFAAYLLLPLILWLEGGG